MNRVMACVLTGILLLAATPLWAGTPLRIMAFNVEDLVAPGGKAKLERYRWDTARKAQFERIAATIETLHPDICALEEVTSKEALDFLVGILHEKGLTDYEGYHVDSSDTFTGFDCCVISRIKPDEIEGKLIRHFGGTDANPEYTEKWVVHEPNGNIRLRQQGISRHALYYVSVGKRKLGFLGLHLKAQPDDEPSNAQRTAEAKIAQRIIQKEIIAKGYEPIVLGDLNDYDPGVPDADESRNTQTEVLTMLKDFDPDHKGVELANVAEKMPRQADRYSNHWDRNENEAADGDDVFTMIDHILIPREFLPGVKRAWIAHVNDLHTSDHWPVVVDVELP